MLEHGKELKKTRKNSELKKYWREKVIDRTLNGRAIITHSIAGYRIRINQFFPELYEHSDGNVKIEFEIENRFGWLENYSK